MPQLNVIAFGNTGAVVIPPELLASMGLRIGDTVDAAVADNHLILRPADDAARRELFEGIVKDLLVRRREAYQRLA